MLRKFIFILTMGCCAGALAGEPIEAAAPNATEQEVRSIFGGRLEEGDRAENLLLLAIAFDHHAEKSPTQTLKIGIPFITKTGPAYWVRLLQQESNSPSLDTLVNNALILTFTADPSYPIEVRREAAGKMLAIAAKRNYWPAQVYLAERQLQVWNQRDKPIPATGEAAAEVEEVFNYLSQCSRIGFAPCQFQLGFWYMQNPASLQAGIDLLRAGIEVVRRDRRYMASEEVEEDFERALETVARVEPGQAYKDLLAEYRAGLDRSD